MDKSQTKELSSRKLNIIKAIHTYLHAAQLSFLSLKESITLTPEQLKVGKAIDSLLIHIRNLKEKAMANQEIPLDIFKKFTSELNEVSSSLNNMMLKLEIEHASKPVAHVENQMPRFQKIHRWNLKNKEEKIIIH